MSKQLLQFLKTHKEFIQLDNGKIQCTLTGHDLIPDFEEVQKYLDTKSYKKGQDLNYDFAQHEPLISQHRTDPQQFNQILKLIINSNLLFCNLTNQKFPKRKSVLIKHLNGRKYIGSKEEYLKQQDVSQKQKTLKEQKLQNYEQGLLQKKEDLKQSRKGKVTEEKEDNFNIEEMDNMFQGQDGEEDEDLEEMEEEKQSHKNKKLNKKSQIQNGDVKNPIKDQKQNGIKKDKQKIKHNNKQKHGSKGKNNGKEWINKDPTPNKPKFNKKIQKKAN